MMPLSSAIRTGTRVDPLESALCALGHDLSAASAESGCLMAVRSLFGAWPHLGTSVRTWPHLAANLERLSPPLISRYCKFQLAYRREVHMSLYKAITALHDLYHYTNAEIADLLKASHADFYQLPRGVR